MAQTRFQTKSTLFFFTALFVGMIFFACRPANQPPLDQSVQTENTRSGFTNFETEPVRPLALSTDSKILYTLNTFDDRLEIYSLENRIPRLIGQTLVGLRPVAITLRTPHEAWVTNHLSDSVSVVDIRDPSTPAVIQTIPVGDEPRGIVAAGKDNGQIFVACARRDNDLTPGIGRAQIWVLDAAQKGSAPRILTLFGMKPRALAVSPDGKDVYAAIFHSGNKTATTSGEHAVQLGFAERMGPLALSHIRYKAVPKAGAIVQQKKDGWFDGQGRDWSRAIEFDLTDQDVFKINADTLTVTASARGVGTVLFDLAVQPGTNEIWTTNTEAENLIIHEPNLLSRFALNRISRVSFKSQSSPTVIPVDLNPHIDRSIPTGNPAERSKSLAQPSAIVFEPDGSKAYITAFGSSKIAVLNKKASVLDRIDVGFGPGGLALAPESRTLYVLNHLDGSISVVDLKQKQTIETIALQHNPVPDLIRRGRPLLYDARITSGHGDLSCTTCHVFGDLDGVAWDLGDPDGSADPIPVKLKRSEDDLRPRQLFHPLKGPMVTQSLRGLSDNAPFHWRGDRFGDADHPGQDIPSFNMFNTTYVNLMGRSQPFPEHRMTDFSTFAMTIHYPPNPNQKLDRTLSPSAQAGFEFYTSDFKADRNVETCEGCHTLPSGSNRMINFEGFELERDMKSAHLRNVYQKIGRYNQPGKQVTGFGLLHDGSMDTVVNFLKLDVFVFPGKTQTDKNKIRKQLHDYTMEFDTGMAPIVGQQLTLNNDSSDTMKTRLSLFMERTGKKDCDLVAYGRDQGANKGWLFESGLFKPDSVKDPYMTPDRLITAFQKAKQPLTFLCVPPGNGPRTILDRDLDGILNRDEE